MSESREEIQAKLVRYTHELKDYEKKLKQARKDKNSKDIVNYSMAVSGYKNTIKELKEQLNKL
jgi:hypothetical protein